MSFFEDILDSDTTIGKVVYAITFLLIAWFVITAIIGGLILHTVIKPDIRGGLRATDLLNQPEIVKFNVPGGKEREGWFFPGQTTSPTIILCHGYGAHRGDLITMVSALQKDRFNIFIFDFSGHGQVVGTTSLGAKEVAELRAAINTILQRTDVDRTRVGIWGFDMGGYTAVKAALADKRVTAIAVDSVYDQPRMMFDLLAQRSGLARVPLAVTFARWGYTLMNWGSRNEPPLSQGVAALAGTNKLFIQGRDNPVLAESTLQLFLRSPEPRKQTVMPKSNYASMLEDERKAYETEVVHFFLGSFPPVLSN